MNIIFYIALFGITILGGMVPLFLQLKEEWNKYILATSGAILLTISFIHLLPETIADHNHSAGIFLLVGFFLQLFLQKFSHGLEHGHVHIHTEHAQKLNLTPLILGLSVHAFLEGIPLGYNFRGEHTTSSLFIAVAAHKAPEAITLMAVVATMPWAKSKKIMLLLQFALLTPIAGLLSYHYGTQFMAINKILQYVVPIVIGAFIHIATTIFFESGTQHHNIDGRKIIAIALGIALGCATLLGEH